MSILNYQRNVSFEHLTESEATELINFNWKKGTLQQSSNYKVKKVEELRRVLGLGLTLNIMGPASRENKLHQFINEKWDYFVKLGTVKSLGTPLLSYKAIVYILEVYEFPLKVNYSKDKVEINRVTTTKFPYSEEQSLAILRHNSKQLEESSGVAIYELKSTPNLAKALKLNAGNLYKLLRENLAELELLGCSKNNSYNLTYRGVVFLLNKQKYPLDLDYVVKSNVIYLNTKPVAVETISQPVVNKSIVEESKPDIEGIRAFLTSELLKRKAKSEEARYVANESAKSLKFIQEANFHLEMLEECLQEVA